jgi:competence protein ComEC
MTVLLEAPLIWAIYLSLALIFLSSSGIAFLLAWVCKWPLVYLSEAASLCEAIPGSFCYAAGPPGWWVAAFYAVIFLPWCLRGYRSPTRWHLAAAVLLSVAGGIEFLLQRPPSKLEFHALAVGHGNCTVLRSSCGRTILLDCGSLAGPQVAERTIAPWLWSKGIGSIDAVFLSHADADHFNALPGLAQRFPVSVVYVTPQFADLHQPAVEYVRRDLAKRGVPLRFVWEGDRFPLKNSLLSIVQPTADFRGRSDNSNSMVVEVRCQGRTAFATGDLADEGLQRLLRRPRRDCDVFVVPHHGGRTSNPPSLADWAMPLAAVSSQTIRPGRPLVNYEAIGAFGLRTDQDGAVSAIWQPGGITIDTFRTRRRIWLPE